MPKTIQKCPVCESTNITFSAGAIGGLIYKCNDCGYVGSLIVEEDVEKKRGRDPFV